MKQIVLLLFFVLIGCALNGQTSDKSQMSVYPNPTIDYISVDDPQHMLEYVAVYNLVGKRVKNFEFSEGMQYSIAELPKGLYLVQLQDKNRKVLKTQKIQKR